MGETEIKLGQVQIAIERLVKEHNISITEWNLKTKRVERILGHLLRHRDRLLKMQEKDNGMAQI